jgi:hypothetical protein
MMHQPAIELDRTLNAFTLKMEQYVRVSEAQAAARPGRHGIRADSEDVLVPEEALKSYQIVAAHLVAIDDGHEAGAFELAWKSVGPFKPSGELLAFVAGLQNGRTAGQRGVRRSAAGALAAPRAEAPSKAEDAIRKRLREARTPPELLAAADEVPLLYRVENDDSSEWKRLLRMQQLVIRLAQWRRDLGDEPLQAIVPDTGRRELPDAFWGELKALEERILREVIADRFNLPDLVKAPPDASASSLVEQIADNAGQRGEWRRALELLQALPPRSSARSRIEKMKAIQTYLAGMSFETAEDYSDAVSAYELVVEQAPANAPIQESIARLKQLRSAHPEAFAASKDRSAARQRNDADRDAN